MIKLEKLIIYFINIITVECVSVVFTSNNIGQCFQYNSWISTEVDLVQCALQHLSGEHNAGEA